MKREREKDLDKWVLGGTRLTYTLLDTVTDRGNRKQDPQNITQQNSRNRECKANVEQARQCKKYMKTMPKSV